MNFEDAKILRGGSGGVVTSCAVTGNSLVMDVIVELKNTWWRANSREIYADQKPTVEVSRHMQMPRTLGMLRIAMTPEGKVRGRVLPYRGRS